MTTLSIRDQKILRVLSNGTRSTISVSDNTGKGMKTVRGWFMRLVDAGLVEALDAYSNTSSRWIRSWGLTALGGEAVLVVTGSSCARPELLAGFSIEA